MSLRPLLSAAELGVAAERARIYPPGHARHWGFAPEFCCHENTLLEGHIPDAARLLAERPDLWESG